MQPGNLCVINNLATSHLLAYEAVFQESHLSRCIELCVMGLAIDDHIGALWDNLGHAQAYFKSQSYNFNEAVRCFRKALDLIPQKAMFNFHLGATLVQKGEYDEGIRYLQKSIEYEQDFFESYKFLAYTYEVLGRNVEAYENLRKYINLVPDAHDNQQQRKKLEELRNKLQ